MYSTFALALLLSTCNCFKKDRVEWSFDEDELIAKLSRWYEEQQTMNNYEDACKDKVQITAISRTGEAQNYGLLFEKDRVWTFELPLNHSKLTFLDTMQQEFVFFRTKTSVDAASFYWTGDMQGNIGYYELYFNKFLHVYRYKDESYKFGEPAGSKTVHATTTIAEWNQQLLYEMPDPTDDVAPDCISYLENGKGLDGFKTIYKVFNKPKMYTRVCKREYEEPVTCENHDGIFGPKAFNQSLLKQLTKPCKAMEFMKYKFPGKNESFMLLYVDDEYLHIIRESSVTNEVKLTELFDCNESLSGRSMRKMKRKLAKGAAKAALAGTMINKLRRRMRKRRKLKKTIKRFAIGAGMLGTGALVAFGGLAAGLLAFCLTH